MKYNFKHSEDGKLLRYSWQIKCSQNLYTSNNALPKSKTKFDFIKYSPKMMLKSIMFNDDVLCFGAVYTARLMPTFRINGLSPSSALKWRF